MMPTPELERTGKAFAPLCHFDSGACTGPKPVLDDYQKYGFVVGRSLKSTRKGKNPPANWHLKASGAC